MRPTQLPEIIHHILALLNGDYNGRTADQVFPHVDLVVPDPLLDFKYLINFKFIHIDQFYTWYFKAFTHNFIYHLGQEVALDDVWFDHTQTYILTKGLLDQSLLEQGARLLVLRVTVQHTQAFGVLFQGVVRHSDELHGQDALAYTHI